MGAKPQPARDPKAAPALPFGCVLQDRFVIQRLLGAGGMGQVYEAEDLRLNRARIALKTIRSDCNANTNVRERFQREVLLARSITHPNVCPVYELFVTDSPPEEIWFLTMKLLQGETLAARLARAGPLPIPEALAIARQIAAALEAAHQAGIVHRDLKPANIFLEEQSGNTRAVVTDFGLAQTWIAGRREDSTTVAGTPGYMAPEVLLGHPATPRSDVYSFGIVLANMIFGPAAKLAAGVDAETEPLPKDPSSRRALDIIRQCTEGRPELRFSSAAAALEAFDRIPERQTAFTTRRKILATAVGAVAAIATAGWLSEESIRSMLHPVPRPRRVALLPEPLANSSPGDASLLNGMLDSVGYNLARAEAKEHDLFVVPPRYLRQQRVREASQAVGLFGVNLLIRASLNRTRETLEIPLALLRAESSSVIRQLTIRCLPANLHFLPGLVERGAAKLLDIPPADMQSPDSAAKTTSAEAYAAFVRARDLLYLNGLPNIETAITELQKALNLDSRFAEAWAALGQAYSLLYGFTRDSEALDLADRNVAQALELAPGLVEAYSSRAAIEVNRGQYDRAIHDLETAATFDTENTEVQLTLAHTYAASGKLDLADRTYQRLLQQRPNDWTPLNDWGTIYFRRANYARAEQLFREATIAAPQAALPWRNLGAVYLDTNQFENAQRSLDRSLALLPSGEAYSNQGTALLWLGRYEEAVRAYRGAVNLNPGRYELWGNLGDANQMVPGMNAEAKSAWRKAVTLAQNALAVNPNSRGTLASLALYQAKLGDSKAALQSLTKLDTLGPLDAGQLFNEALTFELIHQREMALKLLTECIHRGYSPAEIGRAPELESLRKDTRFKRLGMLRSG